MLLPACPVASMSSLGACRGFKDMVLYIEACEAGSLFEGMMSDDMNIYVTTAANAHESSWGTYCPGMVPSPPSEFTTCLGDLYSVSWMENRSVWCTRDAQRLSACWPMVWLDTSQQEVS